MPLQPDWTGFWQGVVRGIEDRRQTRPVPVRRSWWESMWRPRWALGGALATALLVSLGVWQWAPSGLDGPWLVVAGSADTFCPAEALAALGGTLPAATVTVIDGADHFFFTGMPRLRAALSAWAGTLARRTSAAGDQASPCRPTG